MRRLLPIMMAAGILFSLARSVDQPDAKTSRVNPTFEALKAEFDAANKNWSDHLTKELDAAKKVGTE